MILELTKTPSDMSRYVISLKILALSNLTTFSIILCKKSTFDQFALWTFFSHSFLRLQNKQKVMAQIAGELLDVS